MFQREKITFRPHTVLKADMLSVSCQAPMEYLELQYSGWSDGIVAGTDIVIGEQMLTVNPGILLYKGKLFRMTEPETIPYTANGKDMKLRIHFDECKEREEGQFFVTDFILTEEEEVRAGDMEIARFCLQEGAVLRNQYQNFEDLGTQYNTLNVLHAQYAGFQRPTLSPVIMQEYAKEVRKCVGAEESDFAFLVECLRGKAVNRDIIKVYIERKLNIEIKEVTNKELYQYLKQILTKIRVAKRQNPAPSGRRILIE